MQISWSKAQSQLELSLAQLSPSLISVLLSSCYGCSSKLKFQNSPNFDLVPTHVCSLQSYDTLPIPTPLPHCPLLKGVQSSCMYMHIIWRWLLNMENWIQEPIALMFDGYWGMTCWKKKEKIPQSGICPAPCMLCQSTVVFAWKCHFFCFCAHVQCRLCYIYHVEIHFRFRHLVSFLAKHLLWSGCHGEKS